MSSAGHDRACLPVILLKTRSPAGDAYEDLFSAPPQGGRDQRFLPRFVPVLQHRFEDEGLGRVRGLLQGRKISHSEDASFGGLIFTSQRAVEAFTQVVQESEGNDPDWPHLQSIPVYSVGPATTRALGAVHQTTPLDVVGAHTGNGDALADFILADYALGRHAARASNPPLLFLVGDQRRDVIPRTLMDPTLPDEKRVPVEEVVVYGTGEMASFPGDFASVLDETEAGGGSGTRWVVVFSPTGCDSMLRGLGMLDEGTGKVKPGQRDGKTFIATIGPTTRRYLVKTFNFEPDVCAEAPTPEGVMQGILDYESRRN